jgi:hypothetical protein
METSGQPLPTHTPVMAPSSCTTKAKAASERCKGTLQRNVRLMLDATNVASDRTSLMVLRGVAACAASPRGPTCLSLHMASIARVVYTSSVRAKELGVSARPRKAFRRRQGAACETVGKPTECTD